MYGAQGMPSNYPGFYIPDPNGYRGAGSQAIGPFPFFGFQFTPPGQPGGLPQATPPLVSNLRSPIQSPSMPSAGGMPPGGVMPSAGGMPPGGVMPSAGGPTIGITGMADSKYYINPNQTFTGLGPDGLNFGPSVQGVSSPQGWPPMGGGMPANAGTPAPTGGARPPGTVPTNGAPGPGSLFDYRGKNSWGNNNFGQGNADVSSGLFGNISGMNAIYQRFVGDNMPKPWQDPTAPGNTWMYTF